MKKAGVEQAALPVAAPGLCSGKTAAPVRESCAQVCRAARQDIREVQGNAFTQDSRGLTLNHWIKRTGCPFLLAGALVLLAACGGADPAVIATGGDYHPFNFVNEQGEIDGLERALGDELCRRAGLQCRWVLNEWETMIPNLLAEEFDVILAGMSITDQREELIDFTQAYYPPTPSVYLARAGEGDAAANGRVGVSANTIYSDYLTELGTPFESLDHSINEVDALLGGQVDSVLVDHGYAVQKLDQLENQLEIVGPSVLLDRGLGIGVRPGSELEARLDDALDSMKVDGTLNGLILKWLGEKASTFE